MITFNFSKQFKIVLLANGSFPQRAVLLSALENCEYLICCDGAVDKLQGAGVSRKPDIIIGDLDSVSSMSKNLFQQKIHFIENQNSNDLEKGLAYCHQKGWDEVLILGAAGLREDHFIGNFSLLMSYGQEMNLVMATETNYFIAVRGFMEFEVPVSTPVSLFAKDPSILITSVGLEWSLNRQGLSFLHQGILNKTNQPIFSVFSENGATIVSVNI